MTTPNNVKSVVTSGAITLDPSQERAVDLAVDHRIAIITGGPGTGKTTTLKAILDALDLPHYDVALASPTGKAARRMSEACDGRTAKTIHRLLEYSPQFGGFTRNHKNPLEQRLVVIDEASMLDVHLAYAMLDAIDPRRTKLLLIGDKDQLPPVGPGNTFRDLIESKQIPTATLEVIHRQDPESWIAVNAAKILRGEAPVMSPGSLDYFAKFVAAPLAVQDELVKLVPEAAAHGLDPISDVQVLCPQRVGVVGVAELNKRLQAELNPPRGQQERRGLRVGDKVLHTVNNYTLEVFNGEVGRIKDIQGAEFLVDMGDRDVTYVKPEHVDQLTLAYAMTIHKSQGSEWPMVAIVIHSTNTFMLSRNLIYTGITRGKRFVYTIGDAIGLQRGVKNAQAQRRTTHLKRMLLTEKEEQVDAA